MSRRSVRNFRITDAEIAKSLISNALNDFLAVATARRRNAILVTCDEPILHYAEDGHLTVLEVRR